MSSTKSQSDGNFIGSFDKSDHLPACIPYTPHRKWWLQNHEQIYFQEKLDRTEAEITSKANSIDQTRKFKTDGSECFDQEMKVVDSYVTLEQHGGVQDLNAIIGDDLQKIAENKDVHEFSVADTYTLDSDFDSSEVPKHSKKLCSDLDSCWIGGEKTEPWWRTTDRGDLASIVTYKSLEHIERCDLSWPQKSRDFASASMDKTLSTPSILGCCPHNSDSRSSRDGLSAEKSSFSPTQKVYIPEVSRVQLLEALCHSQTRAREAEKLAQQAYDEKEEITELYFRQASHLFAYRQWVEVLHLHTLLQTSLTHFPVLSKGKQPTKGREWTRKRKPRNPRTNINKWFVAFAVGLGLVGAGLLLGWTIGWLFHTF